MITAINNENRTGIKKRKTGPFLIISGIIVLAALVFLFFSTTAPIQGKTVDVKAVPVSLQPIKASHKIFGVLTVEQSVTITSKVSGTVKTIVQKGDRVKTGDILAQLDDTDVQLQVGQTRGGLGRDVVKQLELSYNLAEDTYQKNKALYEVGAISQMQLEQLQIQRDTSKIQYETAVNMLNTQLERTIIKSPIDGVVVTKNIRVGESAAPGLSVLSIVSMDPVLLKGNIPENMAGLVQVGQEVKIKVDALPGQSFKGEVTFVSPVSVPTGQFFPVEISIANPQSLLKAGMTAYTYLEVNNTSQLPAVPRSSIIERDGQKYVYVVNGGKAKRVPVITGLQDENYVEIPEALKLGEQVISTGADQIQDGDIVNINTGS